MPDLSGRTALVTGATQGVGRAIAVALAEAGADLVIHGLKDDDEADRTRELCVASGAQVGAVFGDLSGPTEVVIPEIAREAWRVNDRIDLLVNNAGSYFDVPFLELDFGTFEKTMRLNVFAYFFLTQWFARRWVEAGTEGRVLLIGSINGRLAESVHASYDTSKGAVEMMVRTLCVELAPQNIRVNGLAPGLFHTPLTAAALDQPAESAWMRLHTPNQEVPGPEVAGDAAVFLLSDGASHVHGQMLLVDGGMSAWQQPAAPPLYVNQFAARSNDQA